MDTTLILDALKCKIYERINSNEVTVVDLNGRLTAKRNPGSELTSSDIDYYNSEIKKYKNYIEAFKQALDIVDEIKVKLEE